MKIEEIINDIHIKVKNAKNPTRILMSMDTYKLICLYKFLANKSREREVKIDYFGDETLFGLPILIENVKEAVVE